MPYQEFQENWKSFSELMEKIPTLANDQMTNLMKKYVEQNLIILNDVFTASIDNLKQLQQAKSMNEIICIQAKFTSDIHKKISMSTQRFLNASLGHISDYNEWLKAHCDLATD